MVLMTASMLITFQSISSLSSESGDDKEEWSKHGHSGKEIITIILITMIIINVTTIILIIRNGVSMLESKRVTTERIACFAKAKV